jgi:hypothetical protein
MGHKLMVYTRFHHLYLILLSNYECDISRCSLVTKCTVRAVSSAIVVMVKCTLCTMSMLLSALYNL